MENNPNATAAIRTEPASGKPKLLVKDVRKSYSGIPVGPNQNLAYTISIKNTGNLTATGVTITDPIPANTAFVSAGSGGTHVGGNVVWTMPIVPTPSEVPVDGPFSELGLEPGSVTVKLNWL